MKIVSIILIQIVTYLTTICQGTMKPEEGPYMEGDIMPSPSADGVIAKMRKWEDGIVPYEFQKKYPAKKRVEKAMKEFEKYTCVRFREARMSDVDYIVIGNRREPPVCASHIGKISLGPQFLSLSVPECTTNFGTILHELMHAIGLFHEHTRKDRDKYIKILWDNILNTTVPNFVLPHEETNSYGVSYDFKSLMHYGMDAFSKDDGLNTIEVLDKSIDKKWIGQRKNFSKKDLLKINRLYNCTIPDNLNLNDD